MIDRAKNVCYIIEVPYEIREGSFINYKWQKFLSLHGGQTKHFIDFRDRYFNEVLNVSTSLIGEWDKDGKTMYTQSAVSWARWKEESVRSAVFEGITDLEKCW